MKAISLHGPWAYYERANAEKESRIQQLLGEVKTTATTSSVRMYEPWRNNS